MRSPATFGIAALLGLGALVLALGVAQITWKTHTILIPSFGIKKTERPTPIFVDIFEDGRVEVNNVPVIVARDSQMLSLQRLLEAKLREASEPPPVIIRPDPLARKERIIDVLNAAAAAGVKNLTFS